jgi:hypothetical protein
MMAAFLTGERNPKTGLRKVIEITMQPNMCMRRLKDGRTSYYRRMPQSAKRRGLPVHEEALGSNFIDAAPRAVKFNARYGSFGGKPAKSSCIAGKFAHSNRSSPLIGMWQLER